MKVRLAKKIMKYRSGSFLYDLMRLEGLDVSKELSKIKQYWSLDWLCIMPLKVVVMAELTIVS